MMISLCDKIENVTGKGENADHQHFLLFHNVFENMSSLALRIMGHMDL